jgi:DNA-binding IclR family transcriptional regulator
VADDGSGRALPTPGPNHHRSLGVLERFGYVVRDPATRAYRLGPSVVGFARENPVASLGSVAIPVLHAVHRASGEEVSLAALSESRDNGIEVCVVGQEQQPIRNRALYAGAAYKALLSQLGHEEQPARLRRELAAVRRRGWAFSRADTVPGSWSLAVPVPGGSSCCALGVREQLGRLDRKRARHRLTLLQQATRRLGDRLRQDNFDELVAAGGGA